MNDDHAIKNTLLNEHQHRGLSTRLSSIERELHKPERLVKGGLAKGELFEITTDLTQAEIDQLIRMVNSINKRGHKTIDDNQFI